MTAASTSATNNKSIQNSSPVDSNQKSEDENMETADLRRRVEELKKELVNATEELRKLCPSEAPPPLGKRGYVCKWMERRIGWGGTKWSLRFVVLEQGRLAYYRTHRDISPRYVLFLAGCAVRDEGVKSPRNLTDAWWGGNGDSHSSDLNEEEEGEKPTPKRQQRFHVFSVYRRPPTSSSTSSAEGDDETITPLLRFSSTSEAEKDQWIDTIAEACAYCQQQQQRQSQFELQSSPARSASTSKSTGSQTHRIADLPASELSWTPKKGRLPPLYLVRPHTTSITLSPLAKRFRKTASFDNSHKVNKALNNSYPPSRPMHLSAGPSYLSAEAESQNFRGLFNLALILLFFSNFRLLLDTISNHGSIFSSERLPSLRGFLDSPESTLEQFPFLTGVVLLPGFVSFACFVEKQLASGNIEENFGMMLHYSNAHMSLIVSTIIVWYFIMNPAFGAILLLAATTTWMKLISYVHANCDYRNSRNNSFQATLGLVIDLNDEDSKLIYPRNVTAGNIIYFWFAPTLTYQIAYPKTPRIRWAKILGIVFRLVVALVMLLYISFQIVTPSLDNLTKDYAEKGMSPSLGFEYLCKLSLSTTYCWLLFFYIYFHLFLNLIAELLRFGDRVFYKDWWNASEISAYWRLWNLPVHFWLIRHLYFPCIRMKMSKNAATFMVFFVSAVLHELLISVPFHIVSFWSFIGMMGQLPLVAITKYLDRRFQGTSIGNIIFWLSFCVVGQPMAVLLYAIDYWEKSTTAPVGSHFPSMAVKDNQCTGTNCEL